MKRLTIISPISFKSFFFSFGKKWIETNRGNKEKSLRIALQKKENYSFFFHKTLLGFVVNDLQSDLKRFRKKRFAEFGE
ncbi:hypothetical protein [Leptospira noguchii]|uniref:hypothetical protein n=1 Tax=Leptospira noguchii TaxID=28182 RepID=UPI001FB663DB|nr:hypothetical protein [Leptospira noguchii]UOG59956.1 hypothetical protein MAL07_14530 [Leptospira noguchii]